MGLLNGAGSVFKADKSLRLILSHHGHAVSYVQGGHDQGARNSRSDAECPEGRPWARILSTYWTIDGTRKVQVPWTSPGDGS